MIKERYVSFEVAKMLKEKGFDEPCRSYFLDDIGDYRRCAVEITNKHCSFEQLLRPTLYMTMEWLRDEKNIMIYVYPVIDLPVKNNCTFYWRWDGKKKRHDAPHIGDKYNYESFEQAVEAAIKYSLKNLI